MNEEELKQMDKEELLGVIKAQQYEIENVFESLQQIEKTLGYSSGNIAQVCNRKRKSAYGYIWRYVNE